MNKIKVGIISFAHSHAIGYYHTLTARHDVIVAAIADEVRERVEPYLNNDTSYYADYHEMLNQDLDAVVICSENVYHAQITKEAAIAGKHVLCEKPLGISVEEMHEMIQVCKQSGVELMTAFPCRFLPPVVKAREAVQRGEIGDIIAIKGTNRGSMPGRWFIDPALSGGGAILDHTVHLMDLYNWFLDSRPTEVYAEMGTLFHNIQVDDSGMVHVKYENGVFAVIDTSWSRPKSFPTWGDVGMQIIGTKGVITIDSFAQKNDIYSNHETKAKWSYWGDSMDQYMIENFILSIKEGKSVPVTGEDGLNSAAVALAAYDSVKQGKPVPIPY
ncbi:Gfo/Idh/MocA family protein [Paenibacillus periandrae]|uniref:Gfo/Idh/MocA family protein n=1 Tax=Paenibacillus periandrae TaxID=1761741 RepID=UPI001F099AD2|nr:Gfo/Idh/MocA family oxidoreductase [Paenibacillus periandrae]